MSSVLSFLMQVEGHLGQNIVEQFRLQLTKVGLDGLDTSRVFIVVVL